ncbi:hypothetical protein GCM10009128_05450 [Psychrosphaera haliotis]|uniref:hypothetical protein n=1 Tax=Psychrosphaera haliotis TaxID=555083 RepID=UPI0031E30130
MYKDKVLIISLFSILANSAYAQEINLDAAISHYKGSEEITHKVTPYEVEFVNPDIPSSGRKNRVIYDFNVFDNGACVVYRSVGTSNSRKLRTKAEDLKWAHKCSYKLPNYGICGITGFDTTNKQVSLKDNLKPVWNGWKVNLYAKKSFSASLSIACLI